MQKDFIPLTKLPAPTRTTPLSLQTNNIKTNTFVFTFHQRVFKVCLADYGNYGNKFRYFENNNVYYD